ncbi:MAG: hypothetical protein WDN31_18070 [Hyphomicrobium sp.]
MSDLPKPELWCIDLIAAAPALLAFEIRTPRLSEDETHRAASLSDRTVRDEWLAAHIALRLSSSAPAGPNGGASPTRTTNAASRASKARDRVQPLSRLGPGAYRDCAQGIIGVDIERTRTVRIDPQRRARIRAAAMGLSSAPLPDADDAAFLQAWVRLEALAKAEGCGHRTAPHAPRHPRLGGPRPRRRG